MTSATVVLIIAQGALSLRRSILSHYAGTFTRRCAGVTVVAEKPCHERYAVIDDALIWYGSMNLLSNERDDDTLMRLVSPEIAAELLELSTAGE